MLNIDDHIYHHMDRGHFDEGTLNKAFKAAKRLKARYVEFQHPSMTGDADFRTRVSLHPHEDLRQVGWEKM